MRDHEGAFAVVEEFLEHDDFALLFELECFDDVEGLVEHDLLAALEFVDVDGGADVDAEFASAGEDVDGSVVACLEEDTESGGWLCEPVDLLLECDDLFASLFEGRYESLVLPGYRGQVGLCLVEAFFQYTYLAGDSASLRRSTEISSSRKEICVWRSLTSFSCCALRAPASSRAATPRHLLTKRADDLLRPYLSGGLP